VGHVIDGEKLRIIDRPRLARWFGIGFQDVSLPLQPKENGSVLFLCIRETKPGKPCSYNGTFLTALCGPDDSIRERLAALWS
jgi:hypothetical protein